MEIICRENRIRRVLKVLLPILCLLWVGFIFGNSLRTGEDSSKQSSVVVSIVQDCAQTIAPDSWVANAEGESYEKLHHYVRKLAHFGEFAILGGLLCCCYFAYTSDIKRAYLPLVGVAVTPIVDECLQLFSAGRVPSLIDVLIDIGGGVTGFLFAAAFSGLFFVIYRAIERRKEKKQTYRYEMTEE